MRERGYLSEREGRITLRVNLWPRSLTGCSPADNECYFRVDPLTSVDNELLFPALLNVSKFPEYGRGQGADLDLHPASGLRSRCTSGRS